MNSSPQTCLPEISLGFSKETQIELSPADNIDYKGINKFSQFRLSWHINGSGGYRCGKIKYLGKSNDYYKIIYYKRIDINELNKKLNK